MLLERHLEEWPGGPAANPSYSSSSPQIVVPGLIPQASSPASTAPVHARSSSGIGAGSVAGDTFDSEPKAPPQSRVFCFLAMSVARGRGASPACPGELRTERDCKIA